MASTLQAWLLSLMALASMLISPAAAQNSKVINDLAYILPLPLVAVILIVIGVVIFCVMRRARYGYFCCLKPRVIRLPEPSSSENSDGEQEAESGTGGPRDNGGDGSSGAPDYSVHPNSTIAPPDYQDALQDVLVVQGEDPNQPPNYTANEDEGDNPIAIEQPANASSVEQQQNEDENDVPTEQPANADSAEQQQQREFEVENQQQVEETLEEVSLDDDDNSADNCDDTTPLNPN